MILKMPLFLNFFRYRVLSWTRTSLSVAPVGFVLLERKIYVVDETSGKCWRVRRIAKYMVVGVKGWGNIWKCQSEIFRVWGIIGAKRRSSAGSKFVKNILNHPFQTNVNKVTENNIDYAHILTFIQEMSLFRWIWY